MTTPVKGRAITATPNDDGTVTVVQAGSHVELDFTPQMVEDSDALSLSEKHFLRELFRHAKPGGTGGTCRL